MKHRISHKKYNGHRVYKKVYEPLNPLDLPPYTVRIKFVDDYTPSTPWVGTLTQVSSSPNVWDFNYESDLWYSVLGWNNNFRDYLLEVLGANTTNVTNMDGLFYGCDNISSVALFDTSNVTDMNRMFFFCTSLTSIPLLNTSNVTNVDFMFSNCTNVQSGALALYQQMRSQPTPPSTHLQTFHNCGKNTPTGSAELAQIPDDWK